MEISDLAVGPNHGKPEGVPMMGHSLPSLSSMSAQAEPSSSTAFRIRDRSIGELICEARSLSSADVQLILSHQRKHGMRFGETAVALKLATAEDVHRALARQFDYDYTPADSRGTTNPELIAALHPFSDEAELFRELRSQLVAGGLGQPSPQRALAVCSMDIGDGKSYVAANTAVALSQLGKRTLLIDADMRTPRQQVLFDLPQAYGLSNILSGRAEKNAVHQIKNLPNLFVMPVGAVPPNPLELLQREAFPMLLQDMLSTFDYVLIDTPAAAHGADSRVIAAAAGASIVIVRDGVTRQRELQEFLEKLQRNPIDLLGTVVNEH